MFKTFGNQAKAAIRSNGSTYHNITKNVTFLGSQQPHPKYLKLTIDPDVSPEVGNVIQDMSGTNFLVFVTATNVHGLQETLAAPCTFGSVLRQPGNQKDTFGRDTDPLATIFETIPLIFHDEELAVTNPALNILQGDVLVMADCLTTYEIISAPKSFGRELQKLILLKQQPFLVY